MKDDLRTLQLIEVDILKEVLSICIKYNLRYYMLGGTLLGAVRHKGFIPWDDDIDIGMPRPDYERFLLVADQNLKEPYQLHTLQTNNSEYSYYYARIEKTDVRVKRKAAIKEVVIPAWIDIFPLDGVPNDEKERKKWIKKCFIYKRLFELSQFSYLGASSHIKKKRPPWKTAARFCFKHLKLEKLISTSWAWNKLDQALKENDYYACDYLINFCGFWMLKEMFPKTVYGNGKLYPFENLLLNGPVDYDYVLCQMYGNYMVPPPDNQREHHYIELLQPNKTMGMV